MTCKLASPLGGVTPIIPMILAGMSDPLDAEREGAPTKPKPSSQGEGTPKPRGLMHRSERHLYSITSLARARRVGGTVRPSALAVFRLIANSYLVGDAPEGRPASRL